ncbi:MAG TPA: NAD-dependent epimerase/dehydratase family protein [Gammaproteobacteria bacterium]
MRILVTGSAGHLGEGLVQVLGAAGHEVLGIDLLPSAFTDRRGSITDRAFVRQCMRGVDAVVHAATLHKPHVATHCAQAFVDTNVTGTLNLLEDAVSAHLLALERAPEIGFARYVVTATTPFRKDDLAELRGRAPSVVRRLYPEYEQEYARRGWRMFPDIGRVYVNDRARAELGWTPRYDFARVLERLRADEDFRSELARQVGWKGYHGPASAAARYPVDDAEKRAVPRGASRPT